MTYTYTRQYEICYNSLLCYHPSLSLLYVCVCVCSVSSSLRNDFLDFFAWNINTFLSSPYLTSLTRSSSAVLLSYLSSRFADSWCCWAITPFVIFRSRDPSNRHSVVTNTIPVCSQWQSCLSATRVHHPDSSSSATYPILSSASASASSSLLYLPSPSLIAPDPRPGALTSHCNATVPDEWPEEGSDSASVKPKCQAQWSRVPCPLLSAYLLPPPRSDSVRLPVRDDFFFFSRSSGETDTQVGNFKNPAASSEYIRGSFRVA